MGVTMECFEYFYQVRGKIWNSLESRGAAHYCRKAASVRWQEATRYRVNVLLIDVKSLRKSRKSMQRKQSMLYPRSLNDCK